MARMKRTRTLPPYRSDGRTTFPKRDVPGVYLIHKAGQLRYVGFSASSVYKALYRHFQRWNEPRRERVTYTQLHDVRVRVIYTRTGQQAAQLERALIVKHRPKDNPNKLKEYVLTSDGRDLLKEAAAAGFAIGDEAPF